MNLFSKVPIAWKKTKQWAKRNSEFERRAGFALIACLAWYETQTPDKKFEKFFPLIIKYSMDSRNYVKKTVNWFLRQTGKKNKNLNKKAIEVTKKIMKMDEKSAKRTASDVLSKLTYKKLKKGCSKKKILLLCF